MWITYTKKLIHRIKGLFTLKHSLDFARFTLKRSRFSAETLPHSIYTYNNLYKKTYSCQSKSVDKKEVLKNKWYFFICVLPFMAGCQKNVFIPLGYPVAFYVHESLATQSHPAEFYLTKNKSCSYPSTTSWFIRNKADEPKISNYSFNKPKEK